MPLPIAAILGLAQVAGSAAPLIAKLVGGDKAEAAGDAIAGIAKAVTGKPDAPTALEVLKADPTLALQFEQAVLDNQNDLERMYLADRQDARARDIEVRKLTGGSNTRPNVMLICAAAALIFIVWQLNNGTEISASVLAIYNMAIGALLKMLGDAFQFEFGSSRGSKEKSAQMARMSGHG